MNQTEAMCEAVILEVFPDIVEIDGNVMYTTPTACFNVKEYFNKLDMNVFFKNAKTLNKTYKGNNRRIEFRLDLTNGKTIWIDAKYLSKTTNLTDAILGDIKRAKTLNGVLWLVFRGEGYTEAVIKSLKEEKHDKVKFVMIDKLKRKLLKEVA